MRWDTGRAGESAEVLDLLHAAARLLGESDGSLTLQSRVAAALAREMRHGTIRAPDAETIRMAVRAVDLATAAGDTRAVAVAKLALQDAMWRPGTAVAAAARHRRDAGRGALER